MKSVKNIAFLIRLTLNILTIIDIYRALQSKEIKKLQSVKYPNSAPEKIRTFPKRLQMPSLPFHSPHLIFLISSTSSCIGGRLVLLAVDVLPLFTSLVFLLVFELFFAINFFISFLYCSRFSICETNLFKLSITSIIGCKFNIPSIFHT